MVARSIQWLGITDPATTLDRSSSGWVHKSDSHVFRGTVRFSPVVFLLHTFSLEAIVMSHRPQVCIISALISCSCVVASAQESKTVVSGDKARVERIRKATMPKIDKPVMFDTPEADAVLEALEIFPPN